ncbi:MAG: signal recognition particle-docking protein FtsY [Desulfovibrionales bacterium]
MGFFSKIKKLWGGEEKPPETEIKEELQPQDQAGEPSPDHTQAKPGESRQADTPEETWQAELRAALQESEPQLSSWLELILQDVQEKGNLLWSRLSFLFEVLEAPKDEADEFIAKFSEWLDKMDYEHISEFRSELQYRLALALDLEDEEDEQSRLFLKLSDGLNKTKQQLSRRIDDLLQSSGKFDEDFWENLEEILIMADVGHEATQELIDRLRPKVRKEDIQDSEQFKSLLRQELADIFPKPPRKPVPAPPEVILTIGVNGVGKTTSIAKLAHRAQMQGKKVLLVAGDTFRAAAVEQLQIWSERVGAGFYSREHGADPASVAYEAMDIAVRDKYDTVFVDTAGRLHTKVDLMEELKKVRRVVNKKITGAPHRTILVLDATTGQNALSQADLFAQAVPTDEIVLTKLDGTAKGGVIVAIALQKTLPITYIGLGEKMEDLRPFSGEDFAAALLD